MLLLLAYLVRRFYRGFVVHLVAFSLIWSPVMQARAVPPAVILVPAAAMMARAFVVAATRVGAQLTATNVAAGSGLALVALAGENWTAVQNYSVNAMAAFHTNISAGVASVAALASSNGINSIVTDFATYTMSGAGGTVYSSWGRTPPRDALPVDPGDVSFPSTPRWDGNPGFLPIAGNSFSTVFNVSGFKTYLCPILNVGANPEPTAQACQTLPEMPFSTFNYGTQYMSIGIGCAYAPECAKAYVAGRLVSLSNQTSNVTDGQGRRIYLNIVSNVAVSYSNCFDSRYTGNASFSSFRCPAALTYDIRTFSGLEYSPPQTYTENYNIDVVLNGPPISQSQTLNDYIDRYPLSGSHPVTPATLASIANAMFSAAANRAGYSGINYFPITAADFTAAAQPGEVVPLSSMVTPIAAAPGTGTGNPTAPGGTATVDLGPNPGIAQPALEGIPTAAQIMAPIFDLFPSLRNFQVPGHTSQCPPFVVPFFGQDYGTTKHCELLESQRAPLGAAALVGWSIAALIIVLGA